MIASSTLPDSLLATFVFLYTLKIGLDSANIAPLIYHEFCSIPRYPVRVRTLMLVLLSTCRKGIHNLRLIQVY